MKHVLKPVVYFLLIATAGQISTIAAANAATNSGNQSAEPTANTVTVPTQILKSGIDLSAGDLAPNTLQLADLMGLTPILQRINTLRGGLATADSKPTLESLALRQSLLEELQHANQLIQTTDLAVDFAIAEINAEYGVYTELLTTYQGKADRLVFQTNAASYVSNGALWAVAESLAIPSWKRPKYAISSGINGIIAGIIPSIASLYAMKASNGGKYFAHRDPNMLTKIFDLPTGPEIEYPTIVWSFLSAVPPGERTRKTRRDQLIDRWVNDKNIPSFTTRSSTGHIALITASIDRPRAETIELLQTRQTMLNQLSAEILKMKRLLYELSLVIHGQKHI